MMALLITLLSPIVTFYPIFFLYLILPIVTLAKTFVGSLDLEHNIVALSPIIVL